jgi:undecaprenyl-diphosphatase
MSGGSFLSAVFARLAHLGELKLVAAFLGVSALLLFGHIVHAIARGQEWSLDRRILLALRKPGEPQVPIGPLWMEQSAIDISALGGFTLMWLLSAALIGLYLLTQHALEAGLFAVSVIGSSLLNAGVKRLIARPRPFVVPHLANVANGSFPSGHAMLSATAYLTLAVLTSHAMPHETDRIYVVAVTMLFVLAIGLSRIYLGVHWPSDVLGGWCLGAVWALAFSAIDVGLSVHPATAHLLARP